MHAGFDYGQGGDGSALAPVVRRIVGPKDRALEAAHAAGLQVLEGRYRVDKYMGDTTDPAALYEVVETAPNLFLTAGITAVLQLATATGTPTAFSASNARLCVGDGTTAASAGQTDLQGTNKFRQLVDSAPTVSGNTATFVATFAQANANFAGGWQEVGVANAASAGAMWSRSVTSLGVKTSSATWVLSWALSIS